MLDVISDTVDAIENDKEASNEDKIMLYAKAGFACERKLRVSISVFVLLPGKTDYVTVKIFHLDLACIL